MSARRTSRGRTNAYVEPGVYIGKHAWKARVVALWDANQRDIANGGHDKLTTAMLAERFGKRQNCILAIITARKKEIAAQDAARTAEAEAAEVKARAKAAKAKTPQETK